MGLINVITQGVFEKVWHFLHNIHTFVWVITTIVAFFIAFLKFKNKICDRLFRGKKNPPDFIVLINSLDNIYDSSQVNSFSIIKSNKEKILQHKTSSNLMIQDLLEFHNKPCYSSENEYIMSTYQGKESKTDQHQIYRKTINKYKDYVKY